MAGKVFRVDAKAVLTLGRNSIKDHTTAVVELIKNAYDADADTVELSIMSSADGHGQVRISDNGHGMSDSDIENAWLRIGFSEKVENKTSAQFGRRKTGEKGIGRLSADRLGSILELRTRRRGARATGIQIDWTKFEQPGKEIGEIQLPPLSNSNPKVPKRRIGTVQGYGTELIISELRQEWTAADIAKLYKELSLLLPPYSSLAKTFLIRLSNNIDVEYNGTIQFGGSAKGEIELSAALNKEGLLSYRIQHFSPGNRSKRKTVARTITWESMAADVPKKKGKESYQLGEVKIRLSYFVRRADLLEGTGLKLSQLRAYLDRNAGVRIYRDMVRVKPYGDPASGEADWLGLGERKISDPAGARRSSFKIGPNQLVGVVFAGRDTSPELIDSSSREGLIENDAFRQLKTVLMRCINLIESKYHEINKENPRPGTKAGRAKASVKSLTGNLSSLTVELSELQGKVGDDLRHEFAAVAEQISQVIQQAQATQRDIEELADQNTVFRGLATVGIASAIFGHETSTSIIQAGTKVRIARQLIAKTPPDIPRISERLNDASGYMDRIASWGKFSLSRVNKDKRQKRKISVSKLVEEILNELEGPMSSSDVELKRIISLDVEARTFPMDVEAVLINFVTNAYHEVKRHQGDRVIRVKLSERKVGQRAGFDLSVSDNGDGIPAEFTESIWEPLFSTKTDARGRATGTGLGLAIVKSAVEELGGEVSVKPKGPLGGAQFSAWFPGGV
ncbi:sensor histidine kinase [Bordetella genomosp. 13]|uniref:histidine kinase n=1 Tax=Bordetella genomosp. 13 TaxID=463040 RepID=A0A1W6ZIA9_9BORD|nr:sensor histidine kinase [Bordetella genomosp. 13]ARP97042.1 hypothetical protein CAL15_23305 [Bordetella genomosp. 13]